ncbi:MAG TPA: TOMM precursor leader peptide-binding protein [Gemmatimonadaceae bacterium]|nr:TOMM precursor leader peptide-binding protein [Gemmatimonadaceae bacterium]
MPRSLDGETAGAGPGSGWRLKRHYSIVAHAPDVVELRQGAWNPVSFTLSDEGGSGKLLGVLNRLDGHLSAAEIAAAEGIPRAEVESLIDQLADLDLLETRPAHALDHYLDRVVPNLLPHGGRSERGGPPPSAVLFGDGGVSEQVGRILTASALSDQYEVVTAADGLRRVLSREGTAWATDGLAFEEGARPFAEWRGRLVVYAAAAVNPLELRALNRVSLHHRFSWIHAVVDGPFLLVGPTFVPMRSACYECLEARVLMNLREAASYQSYKRALVEGRAVGQRAALDAVLGAMLASLTAFEALNFLLTGASFTVGKVLAVYLPTLEFTFNEVLRLPGCPACGPAPERDEREMFFDVRTLLNGSD